MSYDSQWIPRFNMYKKPKCKNERGLRIIVLVTFRLQELQRTLRNVVKKCLNLNLQHMSMWFLTSKTQHKS